MEKNVSVLFFDKKVWRYNNKNKKLANHYNSWKYEIKEYTKKKDTKMQKS